MRQQQEKKERKKREQGESGSAEGMSGSALQFVSLVSLKPFGRVRTKTGLFFVLAVQAYTFANSRNGNTMIAGVTS